MFLWRDQSILPIGVEIGAQAVRLLQLRRKGDRLDLIAAARADIAPRDPHAPQKHQAAVIAALRALRAGHKFQGNVCVSTLPPESIAYKSLRLPQMPESDMAQAIQWEAKDRLGFDLTDGQLAYFRSGEVRRGADAKDEFLLFAATGETLAAHLQQLTAAGLKVLAIDLQPCALFRALQRILPPAVPGATALIDLGSAATQFMIAQDDRLVFYKTVDIGEQALNAVAAQKLGITVAEATGLRQRLAARDPAETAESPEAPLEQAVFDATRPQIEELARELELCLRYYGVTFRGSRPETIYCVGGHSYCARSLELIGSVLGSHIEMVQPLRAVNNLGSYARPDRCTEWTLPTGLGLYPTSAERSEAAA